MVELVSVLGLEAVFLEPPLPLIRLGMIGDMNSHPGGTTIRDVGVVAVGVILNGTAHFLK